MVSILVAGDFCPKSRVAQLIDVGAFDIVFNQVKQVVADNDYSIVNFECPVRISRGEGIKKAGPSLQCSPKSVNALSYVGFNCATLANNHFYDQGESGVRDTISTLEKAGIDHVGGGYRLEDASQTLYKVIKDKRIAIINCCEHEFSIATECTGGSNPLDPVSQYRAICDAKQKADYVLVIVHGGIEHYQYPSPRMVETYRFFIDAGADAVVNHHQHCFSGFEVYKKGPIFYGLGNFCFDWPERNSLLWEEGFMVQLSFGDDIVSCKLYPYNQNGQEVGILIKDAIDYDNWKKRFDGISEVISNKQELEENYKTLLKRTERKYSIYLTPYTNRLLLSFYMRHLLPRFFPKQRLRELLNMVRCESHRDRFIKMLENII